MENDFLLLAKGTVVKINGFPCELLEDTKVLSSVLAKHGVDWPTAEIGQGDTSETGHPTA